MAVVVDMATNEDGAQKMEVDPIKFCLMSNDKRLFLVDKDVVYCSCMIKNMMKNLKLDESNLNEPILLPNVDGQTLEAVLQWSERHRNDPELSDRDRLHYKQLSQWDKEFIKSFNGRQLEKLLDAASYLDIKSLFKASCSVIANDLEKSSIKDIRLRYNIVNDLPEEEERQLRLECEKIGLD